MDSTHFMDLEAMCMYYTYHINININISYTVYYRDMLGYQSVKLINEDRMQMRTQQDLSELS